MIGRYRSTQSQSSANYKSFDGAVSSSLKAARGAALNSNGKSQDNHTLIVK